MDRLLALWPLLLLASLVNLSSLVSWSLSKEATGIYTLTEFNKAPLSHQSLGPRVFLSLSLYFWLIPWNAKAGCITQGILASFFLSLSHRWLQTTRFQSIKGPKHSAFSKTSLNIWNFTVHGLLKTGLENFEHYFTSVWDECNSAIVWAFFGIAFWPFG